MIDANENVGAIADIHVDVSLSIDPTAVGLVVSHEKNARWFDVVGFHREIDVIVVRRRRRVRRRASDLTTNFDGIGGDAEGGIDRELKNRIRLTEKHIDQQTD